MDLSFVTFFSVTKASLVIALEKDTGYQTEPQFDIIIVHLELTTACD
jgi:hypothetical protein